MKATKIKLGSMTLEQLAKEYPGSYPAKLKNHPPKGMRLILQLTPRGK